VIIEPIHEPIHEPIDNKGKEDDLEETIDRIYQDPTKFALENKWDISRLFPKSTIYVGRKGNILLCIDNTKHNPGLSNMLKSFDEPFESISIILRDGNSISIRNVSHPPKYVSTDPKDIVYDNLPEHILSDSSEEPDLSQFYKWTDHILIIKSSYEETYYQFLEHMGKELRYGCRCILYCKESAQSIGQNTQDKAYANMASWIQGARLLVVEDVNDPECKDWLDLSLKTHCDESFEEKVSDSIWKLFELDDDEWDRIHTFSPDIHVNPSLASMNEDIELFPEMKKLLQKIIVKVNEESTIKRMIEIVNPLKEEIPYINAALKLPGDYLGIVPLKNYLCLICYTHFDYE